MTLRPVSVVQLQHIEILEPRKLPIFGFRREEIMYTKTEQKLKQKNKIKIKKSTCNQLI